MVGFALFLSLLVSSYSMQIVIESSPDEVNVATRGSGELRVLAKGWMNETDSSEGGLPSRPIFVVVPQNTEVAHIEVVEADTVTLATGKLLKLRSKTGKLIENLRTYSLSGYRIASFKFAPLIYHEPTQKLLLLRRVTLRLELESVTPVETPLYRAESDHELLKKAIAELVVNPEDVDVYAPPTEIVDPMRDTLRNIYPYVIVTTDELKDDFEYFKLLKTLEGRPLLVRTVSWINAHYAGADLQERVRNFLKDMYLHHGTMWAMLAGDSPFVPARIVSVPIGTGYYDDIPTDFYYACLDGDWDLDNDGRYAELEDSADILPDIFVSRMPFRSHQEVQRFMSKYLTYISGPTSDTNYFTRALFVGAELFAPGDGAQLCEEIRNEFPTSFHTMTMYEVGDSENDVQDFIDTLNSGVGMVIAEVHGWYTFINVNSDPTQTFDYNDVDSLRNTHMPTFFNIVSCEIGGFDRDCIVEHLLRAEGGAIAVLSSTRNNYPYTVQPYNLRFYELLFDGHIRQIGLLDLMSRNVFVPYANSYNHSRYALFSYSLLGDPGLRLWDDTPIPVSIETPEWVTTGLVSLNVHVTSNGSPLPSVRVAAFKPGETYVEGWTDATGSVRLWVNPKTSGTLLVGVTDSSGFLALDTVVVFESGVAPYVVDFDVKDADCDGKPEPGEELDLFLRITNGGFISLYNTWGKVDGVDTTALMSFGDSAFIDTLHGGDTLALTVPLRVSVRNSVPDGYRAFVALTFYNSVDTVSFDTIYIQLAAPRFVQWFTRIENSGAGRFKVFPGLANVGGGDAKGVRLRLLPSPGIQIFRDTAFIYSVPSGGVGYAEDGFVVRPIGLGFLPIKMNMLVYHPFTGSVDTFQVGLSEVGTPESLSVMSGIGSIRLSWNPPSDGGDMVIGYLVYRSDSGRNFELITPEPISHSSFEDFDITPGRNYTYRIAAIDSLMNEGPPLESNAAVSYELLEGWPKIVMGPSVPLIADIDSTFEGKEIVVPSEDGHVYAFHWDGSEVDGWPVDIGFVLKGLAAADFDNDGYDEVVAVPYRGKDSVFVFKGDGTVLEGWPRHVPGGSWAAPTVYDLDDDGSPEVIVHAVAGKLYVWRADGTAFSSYDTSGLFVELPEGGGGFAEVAVGDIDDDGETEIVVGDRTQGIVAFNLDRSALPGFPTGYGTMTTISIADFLPSEPGLEIVTFHGNSRIYLFKSNGEVANGWPVTVSGTGYNFSMHAIPGDIDGDGEPEIICNLADGVGALNPDGSWVDGFPFAFDEHVYTTGAPLIADVDGDGSMEAFQPGYYKFFGVQGDGTPYGSFPLDIVAGSYRSAAIDDIDLDGHAELVIPATDGFVYVFRLPGQFTPNGWLQYQHDAARTGNYELGHRRLETVSENRRTLSPTVKVWPSIVKDAFNVQLNLPRASVVSVSIYDIAGRRVYSKSRKFERKGENLILIGTAKLRAGVYFYRVGIDGRNLASGKFVVLK